jgi:hypothetical protein
MTGVRALRKGRSRPRLDHRNRVDWGPDGEAAGWRMGLMGAPLPSVVIIDTVF